MDLKASHEQRCEERQWASEADLEYFSSLLASLDAEADGPAGAPGPRPRLVVRDGPRDSFLVVNDGDADAFKVRVEDATVGRSGGMLHLEDAEMPRLSPGGRWSAGLYMRSASGDTFVVRVLWEDADGETYDAEFPLV
jgi:hypothetical protein